MAGTQQHGTGALVQPRQVQDGGFDAHFGRPAFQHRHAGRDLVGEFRAHVLGQRRRDLPELIGRRRRHPALPFDLPAAKAASKAWATGCEGQRRPMLSCPPLTVSAMCGARLRISVSGPGQNASISSRASAGTCAAQYDTSAPGAIWTITGWLDGRPLAA